MSSEVISSAAAQQTVVFNLEKPRRVAYSCKYPGCRSAFYRSGPNIKFFRFPKNEERRVLWARNCKIDPRKSTKSFTLCEKHFGPEAYYDPSFHRRLMPHAVPKEFTTSNKSLEQCSPNNDNEKEVLTEMESVEDTSFSTESQSNELSDLTAVCDQSAANRASISQLCVETVKDTPSITRFIVDDCDTNCVYDVCQLMKNTRNALLENKILFEDNKCAKFEYIKMVFDIDQTKTYKSLCKLKPEHFNFKNPYNRESVTIACRQLSYSVASAIETYCLINVLPSEAFHTAEFAHLMDQLFDSLNGPTESASEEKPLRGAVSADSPHIKFWMDVLPKIAKWKVINLKTGADVTDYFLFINGWQIIIQSAIAVWKRVLLKT